MAITAWTDNDSAGIPMNWGKPNLSDSNYVQTLINALFERVKKCDSASANFKLRDIKDTRLNCAYLNDMLKNLKEMIPYYVNHTINSGNFHGYSSIPMWTLEDILDATGYTEIYSPTIGEYIEYLGEIPKRCDRPYRKFEQMEKFGKQMYDMINLLRWVAKTPTGQSQRKAGGDLSWSVAVSNFNSCPWTDYDTGSNICHYSYKEYSYYPYLIVRERRIYAFVPDENESCTYDFYMRFTKPGIKTRDVYQNADYPTYEQGIYQKLEQGLLVKGADPTMSNPYGYFDTMAVSQPSTTSAKGYVGTPTIIRKYDHADGFTFRGADWT